MPEWAIGWVIAALIAAWGVISAMVRYIKTRDDSRANDASSVLADLAKEVAALRTQLLDAQIRTQEALHHLALTMQKEFVTTTTCDRKCNQQVGIDAIVNLLSQSVTNYASVHRATLKKGMTNE
jgi:hypothetical protein